MGLAEIGHRVGEQAKRLIYRNYDEGFDGFRAGEGSLPIISGVSQDVLAHSSAEFEDDLSAAAAAARGGDIRLLGATWPQTLRGQDGRFDAQVWHLDPFTGRKWPGREKYCFDVAYRQGDRPGEVKYVWDMNRLQFLQPIAVESVRSGDAAGGAAWVMDTIRGWMAANPPFRGINWCSGIELGLRVATVTICVSVLGGEAFSERDRAEIRTFINAHGFWIARFPSAHSSANNHLVVEGMALFLIGLLVTDLEASPDWEARGRNILEREASRQILADGVGAEQSPSYTAFTLEAYLLAILAATRAGRPLDGRVSEYVARSGAYLRWFMDDGGRVPEIGDNDGGRVVAMGMAQEPLYAASIASAVASMTANESAIPPRRAVHIRDLLFGAPRGEPLRPVGLRVFPDGGYSVWRGRLAQRNAMLVFDHGPLGYMSIAAHGHADTLSIWLHLDDFPVLVDAGTYLYHSGGRWREHFRSTPAHNTLTIEGKDSSTTAGSFNWREKARGRLLERSEGDPGMRIVAEHDGYARRLGAIHRREVAISQDGRLTVTDRIVSPREVDVVISFNLDRALRVEQKEAGFLVVRGEDPLMRIGIPDGFAAGRARPNDEPGAGWMSSLFGEKEPITTLQFAGRLGSNRIATVAMVFDPGYCAAPGQPVR